MPTEEEIIAALKESALDITLRDLTSCIQDPSVHEPIIQWFTDKRDIDMTLEMLIEHIHHLYQSYYEDDNLSGQE